MDKTDKVIAQLERLAKHLETMRIAEYVDLLQRPSRLIFINFVAGIARGLGIAVGATLIFAVMVEFLRRIIMLNLPGIGNFIADVLKIVELKKGSF